MQKRERLSQQQVLEWTENPVTLEFASLVQKQIAELQVAKANSFHPFEPQKTQETFAQLEGADDTWDIVACILRGDWDYFMEEESESVRDYPEGE